MRKEWQLLVDRFMNEETASRSLRNLGEVTDPVSVGAGIQARVSLPRP